MEALRRLKKLWKILHIDVISLKELDIDVLNITDGDPQLTASASSATESNPEATTGTGTIRTSGEEESEETQNEKQSEGSKKGKTTCQYL
jgi:ribosomal protein L12E/L44/L45/RPP1/RPP2